MFDFFKTIKRIKALKMIEPDKRWLESRRAMFSALAADSKPSISALPALFGPRLARVVVAFLLITVLTGGAAVNSARAALPDEALYPIKLLSERFQSFFVVGSENRVDFALKLAERRLSEAEAVSNLTDEGVIAGTILRAQNNLAETRTVLASNHASFRNIEKTLEKLDKLAEKKENLTQKFAGKLPAAVAALKSVELTSVEIEEEADRIIITFTTSTPAAPVAETALKLLADRASTTILRADVKIKEIEARLATSTGSAEVTGKLVEAKEKLAESETAYDARDWKKALEKANEAYKVAVKAEVRLMVKANTDFNEGTEQILKFLTEGAGKSGKVPPGLLKSPGIQKNLFGGDNDRKGRNDDKGEGGHKYEGEDNEKTAPVVSGVQVSDISSSSARISWTTDEIADSRVNYGTSTVYGATAFSDSFVRNHSLVIQNLIASTTYHYQVVSRDKKGDTTSLTGFFFTTGGF